jgi:hypothetical protein
VSKLTSLPSTKYFGWTYGSTTHIDEEHQIYTILLLAMQGHPKIAPRAKILKRNSLS